MDQQPQISVLTPVYNGEDFLAECIESVLQQSYKNYEYIIVNNCSTDRTLEIAQEYARKDSRIRIHDNKDFLGVIDNHNLAFSLISSDTKYCKVVSGDDYIFPECIQRLVEIAEANPSVGIVGCYQLSGDIVRWQGFPYPASVIPGAKIGRRFLLQQQVFVNGLGIFGFGSPTSLLYKADLVRSHPDFYPTASPHSDTSACFRYLSQCDFGFVHEILSFERTHAQTQSSKSVQMNRYSSATLDDLVRYGQFYLMPVELESKIKETLAVYHRFLTVHMLMGNRDDEFWTYHKTRLAEIGFPLTTRQIMKAAMRLLAEGVANPKQTIDKVRSYAPNKKNRKVGGKIAALKHA